MRHLATAVLLAIAVTTTTFAGPLRPQHVDADARWLVHVDIEALARSTLGGPILEHVHAHHHELDELHDELGLEPDDVTAVTISGTSKNHEEGVTVTVEGTAALDEVVRRLTVHPELESEVVDLEGFAAIAVHDGDEHLYLHVRPAGAGRRLLVLSEDPVTFVRTMRVITGAAPSLAAGGDDTLTARPEAGSFLFVTARKVRPGRDLQAVAGIFQLSDTFLLDVGERHETVLARLVVSARTPEQASRIAAIMQGLVALGHLAAGQLPDAAPFHAIVGSIDITAHDRAIEVGFECPSSAILEAMEIHLEP